MSNGKVGAAEIVDGYDDLKREILSRLPLKTVTRFKLVSKQWLSLLSDPLFVADLVRRNPNKSPKGIFFCRSFQDIETPQGIDYIPFDDNTVFVPSLSFLNDIFKPTKIWLLQSCNGLFLCRVYPSDLSYDNYCVFNPTIKQYRLLPPPMKNVSSSPATLAFDPSVSPHYKVVIFHRVSWVYGETCEIDIYSSESQSWRYVSYGIQLPRSLHAGRGNFFNGAIHWVGHRSSLCFDVYSEEMRRTSAHLGSECNYIGDYGSHFHLVITDSRFEEEIFIRELSSDFSRWVTKYRVGVSTVGGGWNKICRDLALCVVEGVGGEEDSALLLAVPGKIVSYNFMNKEVRVLCQLPSELNISALALDCIRAYPYIESASYV